MSKLDAPDRRRAYAALRNARMPESLVTDGVTMPIIAAALKREREEAIETDRALVLLATLRRGRA